MIRPPDRIEMPGGITHLPADFREVARLANLAGIEGYRVQDVEVGIDPQAAIAGEFRSYITISYREKEATE
jgi:hypothetical protein